MPDLYLYPPVSESVNEHISESYCGLVGERHVALSNVFL
jgi:hypothetical protein